MPIINWPERYRPGATAVHVSNELLMQAPAERVWAWLIRATLWPSWYENSKDVVVEGGAALRLGTAFRWRTFGLAVSSVVEEFVPGERVGWTGVGVGLGGYHGWVIEPKGQGCFVLTEENQNGLGARAQAAVMPNRMHKHHQIWLESLNAKAVGGWPPTAG